MDVISEFKSLLTAHGNLLPPATAKTLFNMLDRKLGSYDRDQSITVINNFFSHLLDRSNPHEDHSLEDVFLELRRELYNEASQNMDFPGDEEAFNVWFEENPDKGLQLMTRGLYNRQVVASEPYPKPLLPGYYTWSTIPNVYSGRSAFYTDVCVGDSGIRKDRDGNYLETLLPRMRGEDTISLSVFPRRKQYTVTAVTELVRISGATSSVVIRELVGSATVHRTQVIVTRDGTSDSTVVNGVLWGIQAVMDKDKTTVNWVENGVQEALVLPRTVGTIDTLLVSRPIEQQSDLYIEKLSIDVGCYRPQDQIQILIG